ncbi:DUF411 domain-containing protein [Pseudoalteromonas sp. MMG010]|uniref:DUF411 domain-containing protein n=1 Tax=Pseudoalteromonas sp. MMG010 TaxID=2822685 RepID=UPI001B3A15D6|nr:DUF411 domain-containing protein [Pseudoalteromonas sp. MMG010]MBQ4832877.1 DUF411 domain-containing protein [Pseudoalteromonas sp. MMG010]
MIKNYIKITVALLFIPAFAYANEHKHETNPVELLVYKTPTGGCCKEWISHIEDEGIIVQAKNYQDKHGIQPNYRSSHTAITKHSFAFESHVPAKFIQKSLSENRPNAIRLSVPVMPIGSPGMEVGEHFMPYNGLILFKAGTSKFYANIKAYKEQF